MAVLRYPQCKGKDFLVSNRHEVPWIGTIGMRGRLVHAYSGVGYKLVWDAIKTEIPNLKPKLRKILAELEGKDRLETDQR
jgi:uncharacterized protein with HEPN domain